MISAFARIYWRARISAEKMRIGYQIAAVSACFSKSYEQETRPEAVPIVPAPVFTPNGVSQPVIPAQQGNYFPTYDLSSQHYASSQPQGAASNFPQQDHQSYQYQQPSVLFTTKRVQPQRNIQNHRFPAANAAAARFQNQSIRRANLKSTSFGQRKPNKGAQSKYKPKKQYAGKIDNLEGKNIPGCGGTKCRSSYILEGALMPLDFNDQRCVPYFRDRIDAKNVCNSYSACKGVVKSSSGGDYYELRGGKACPKMKEDPWNKPYGNEYSHGK